MTKQSYDIAVVGGGLVGLSCALALGQRGFEVALIEAQEKKEPLTHDFDTKVVALTRASEHFLNHIGVWNKMARSSPYAHIKVWDQVADGVVHFSAMDFFEPNLGTIVEHQVLSDALWQELARIPTVHAWTGVPLQALSIKKEKMYLSIQGGAETHLLETPLVIGADGKHSAVRKMNAISMVERDYHQTALVATVRGTDPHYHTAFQRFSPEGSLAVLPLSDVDTSSIVWTMSPERAKRRCEEPLEKVGEVLTRESDKIMGTMTLLSPCFPFSLRTHHAKHYIAPRCALIGDAAHTLHPLAGQGVNLGFLDVAALVEVLEKVRATHRDWGDLNVLKKYERARRWHNQSAIWVMELFKRGFGSQSWILQQARNQGLNWVDRTPWLKKVFVNIALGKWGPIPSLGRPSY